MAGLSNVFLDTSALIGGLVAVPSTSDAATSVLTAVAEKRCGRAITAWHCCLEFYSVTTRLPEEFRLSPDQALTLLQENVFEYLEITDLRASTRRDFFALSAQQQIAGGRVYDAHLAHIARQEKVDYVVTDNVRHFSDLASAGIAVLSCMAAAERL